MSKTIFFKVRKVAKNRYMIEERHTFMFFWHFFIKGSIHLRIPKYFASAQLAEDCISKKAAEKGKKYFIININR